MLAVLPHWSAELGSCSGGFRESSSSYASVTEHRAPEAPALTLVPLNTGLPKPSASLAFSGLEPLFPDATLGRPLEVDALLLLPRALHSAVKS